MPINLTCIKKKIQSGPDIPAIYTKPPNSSYKLLESHEFYVKGGRPIPIAVPPPCPQNRTKAEVFEETEYLLVDDKAIRVPMTVLSKPVEGLVEYLTEGYEDEISRVRVLFRWLTNQPIHRMQSLQTKPKNSQSALYFLWMLRTKKQRYSKFFSLLCRYAGIYTVTVHGAVKGIHYQIGDKMDLQKHYGEWNAVCVDREWRLVDALWGACSEKDPGDGRGRFTCDERFFFTDPKDLLFTHFADSPKWQLLDSPRHIEDFEESACLKNRFFELSMQVLSHPVSEIEAIDGEVEVLFGVKPKPGQEQKFNCYISHFDRPDSKRYLTKGSNTSVPIFIHKLTDSSISVKVRFPESGIFRMEIVGKEISKGSRYKEYDWVAIYKVVVEEAADRGFPKMDPIGWGPGKEIQLIGLAPFNYTSGLVIAKSVQTKLRFKIVDTTLVQNMKFFFKMASTYDNDYNVSALSDKFEVDMNIMTFFIEAPPFGEYTLKMYARNVRGNNIPMEQRREINVCNYLLISDVQQREEPLGILMEKTEIEDTPEMPRKVQEPRRLEEPPPMHRPSDAAESVVSASNVIMDSNSHKADSMRGSPEVEKDPGPPDHITKVIISEPKSPKQSFVRVDGDLQEIPEIPLSVIQPVKPDVERPREKRELKVVSSNKVVPLKSTGGIDGSIMLVADEDKPTRPKTGLRRARSSDDTKFFTSVAKVKGQVATGY